MLTALRGALGDAQPVHHHLPHVIVHCVDVRVCPFVGADRVVEQGGSDQNQIRVGPLGSVPGMSKLVRVSLLDPVRHDDSVLVPLRWEATGLMGRLFPVLDANLMLGKDDEGRGVLRIAGVYRPPLGGLGQELDQIVLRRVASATIRSLLRRIAALLVDRPDEPAG